MCFTIGPKFRVISAWWGHSPGSEHAQLGLLWGRGAHWQRGAHREQRGRLGELMKRKERLEELIEIKRKELVEKETKSSLKRKELGEEE